MNGNMLPKHRYYGAGSIYFAFMTTDNSGNNGLDSSYKSASWNNTNTESASGFFSDLVSSCK